MLPLSTQIYKWVSVTLMLEGDLVVDKQENLTQSTNGLHRDTKCFFSSFRLMTFLYIMGT